MNYEDSSCVVRGGGVVVWSGVGFLGGNAMCVEDLENAAERVERLDFSDSQIEKTPDFAKSQVKFPPFLGFLVFSFFFFFGCCWWW